MKILSTILVCMLCHTAFGQFAIIADKDGFANVRSSAVIAENIIDTITNGQIVYCFEPEKDWFQVDYHLNQNRKSGYIHKSRVKLIENFEKISCNALTDSTVIFKTNLFKLTVTKVPFNQKFNKLQFHKGSSSTNAVSYLEKINGRAIWGTDGNIPKKRYGQMLLQTDENKLYLPIDNLFEPNLNDTTVNIDASTNTIYIIANNSDGAGGYAVLWIVENGKVKERIEVIPF